MIDAEPAARAAPARVAEPGMLPGITMLSAPEVHEADPRELRERSARLEAVGLGIDAGGARVEVPPA